MLAPHLWKKKLDCAPSPPRPQLRPALGATLIRQRVAGTKGLVERCVRELINELVDE